MGDKFKARHRGDRCGICDERIEVGEDVTYVYDVICHWDCADNDEEYERTTYEDEY